MSGGLFLTIPLDLLSSGARTALLALYDREGMAGLLQWLESHLLSSTPQPAVQDGEAALDGSADMTEPSPDSDDEQTLFRLLDTF